VAVLPFRNNTGAETEDGPAAALAEAVSLSLLGRKDLVVVERERISDVLNELHLDKADLDAGSAVRVGRLLGAHYMIFGSLSHFDTTWMVSERVVSVETGRILAGDVETVTGPGALASAARRSAAKVVRHLGGTAAPAGDGGPANGDDPLLAGLPPARRPDPDALAVVVGVRDYKSAGVPQAEYALRDARAMARYLTDGLGYLHKNVLVLEDPTKAELETMFGGPSDPRGRLARIVSRRRRPARSLFVYYAGHGAPGLQDRHAYLVPSDADPNFVELNGYPRDLLLKNLKALGAAKTVVVLETCFSGSYDRGALITNASPLLLKTADGGVPAGIDLLTSSASDEVSSWYPEKEHSAFTYFLLDAVRERLKKGDALALGPLEDEVSDRVSEYARSAYKREQDPQLVGDRADLLSGR
jgi:hypothetical protein